MAKKKKNHGTQKITEKVDANNSVPYEVVSNKSNTNDIHKNKYKEMFSHTCKCKENAKRNTYTPKTWKSVTQMYGDADTTEVWDSQKHKPKTLFKTKVWKKNKHKLKQIEVTNNKVDQPVPKSQDIKRSGKRSIISLYRKAKNTKHDKRSKTKELNPEKNDLKPRVINFNFRQQPKPTPKHLGTGDVCIGGPCNDIELFYKSQNIKDSTKKNETLIKGKEANAENAKKPVKQNNLCKCKFKSEEKPRKKSSQQMTINKKEKGANVGHGDQVLPTIKNKDKNFQCKCNLITKILRHSCKCKLDNENAGNQTGEPFFEIKVDPENLQVLNAAEIKENVETYGRIQRGSCICPTRMERLKGGKGSVCRKGICEKALKNKQTNFDCKCVGKKKVLKCSDKTCDSKIHIKQKKKAHKNKFYQSPTYVEKYKPLFDVMLDPISMNVINTTEIQDIFNKASNNDICPTGVCSIAAKEKDIQLNCTCIKKKIIPISTECTQETCKQPERKCKLSYLCSRVFSKSENWKRSHTKRNNRRRQSQRRTQVNKEKMKARSDIHRKHGLSINVSRDHNQIKRDVPIKPIRDDRNLCCKCFCECDGMKIKPKMVVNIQSKKKKKRKSKNTKKAKSKVKKQILHTRHHQNINFKQRLIHCLTTKRVRCKEKIKEEERTFKKMEKRSIKENRKINKRQEVIKEAEARQWNCLTKFVAGILNLTTTTIKNLIVALISLIANPVGSYVYARERTKDPSYTIKRFQGWIIRTWRNRATNLSQTIKNAETMNIIADQIEDTAVYGTLFANKGKTPTERAHYEAKTRLRKRRIAKRQDLALYGCRHMLLTTMRKTPCLWFYHICPDLYPQCLSCLAFMNNFLGILIYLAAFLCWTPCILSFEVCRAFLCCFFCTN